MNLRPVGGWVKGPSLSIQKLIPFKADHLVGNPRLSIRPVTLFKGKSGRNFSFKEGHFGGRLLAEAARDAIHLCKPPAFSFKGRHFERSVAYRCVGLGGGNKHWGVNFAMAVFDRGHFEG